MGKLTFPTSGAAAAQQKFLMAVKLLHNFEYEEAIEAFRDCQNIDADFGMAYWGQAMCYNHPLWGNCREESALGFCSGANCPRASSKEIRKHNTAIKTTACRGNFMVSLKFRNVYVSAGTGKTLRMHKIHGS